MKLTSQQVCDDIFLLLNTVKADLFMLAEEQGLTRTQLFSLYTIQQQGNVGMGQLAEVLHCDASNITGIVDRLVAQGLVMRQESPKDRRTKTLQLTAKGSHIVEALKRALPARLGCDKLSATQQASLHQVIQLLCT